MHTQVAVSLHPLLPPFPPLPPSLLSLRFLLLLFLLYLLIFFLPLSPFFLSFFCSLQQYNTYNLVCIFTILYIPHSPSMMKLARRTQRFRACPSDSSLWRTSYTIETWSVQSWRPICRKSRGKHRGTRTPSREQHGKSPLWVCFRS